MRWAVTPSPSSFCCSPAHDSKQCNACGRLCTRMYLSSQGCPIVPDDLNHTRIDYRVHPVWDHTVVIVVVVDPFLSVVVAPFSAHRVSQRFRQHSRTHRADAGSVQARGAP